MVPIVAEADAFAATAAAFADARQAEAAGAERVADGVAPHVAAGAHRIVAERIVATPRSRRCVRIAARAGVEQADHAELGRFAERRLASDVRIGVVLRTLDAEAMARLFGVGVTHRALFALGARTGAAFFVVGVGLGDLLGLLLLLLALGSGVKVLLDQVLLIAAQAVFVGEAHRRDEERHRRDEADVREQREADVEQRVEVGVGEKPVDERLAGGDRGHLEHEAVDLHARLAARRESDICCAPESSAQGCVRPLRTASSSVILGWPGISTVPRARGRMTKLIVPWSASTMGARVVPSFSDGMK